MMQIDGNDETFEFLIESLDADRYARKILQRKVPANCRNTRNFMLYGNFSLPDLNKIARTTRTI